MNSGEIREYKASLKLTPRQREIVVGLLLGDGHLETQNAGRTFRLKVEHGPAQEEYVKWLFTEFAEWVRADSPYRKVAKDGRVSFGFTTYSHGAFRFYGQQFYSETRKKIIPRHIVKLLTPLSLAVWYMDDGSKKSKRHLTYNIHTLGFTKLELQNMCVVLQEKFGIETRLHSQKQQYWRIYIPSNSAASFKELIMNHIKEIPSMMYKL